MKVQITVWKDHHYGWDLEKECSDLRGLLNAITWGLIWSVEDCDHNEPMRITIEDEEEIEKGGK